jgi:hypothetical protein
MDIDDKSSLELFCNQVEKLHSTELFIVPPQYPARKGVGSLFSQKIINFYFYQLLILPRTYTPVS